MDTERIPLPSMTVRLQHRDLVLEQSTDAAGKTLFEGLRRTSYRLTLEGGEYCPLHAYLDLRGRQATLTPRTYLGGVRRRALAPDAVPGPGERATECDQAEPLTLEVGMTSCARRPEPVRSVPVCDFQGEDPRGTIRRACELEGQETYTELLREAEEPSLLALSRADDTFESYRLIWKRSFHPLVLIRIGAAPGEEPIAVTKVGSGNRSERTLASAQWDQLRRLLEDLNFWELPHEVIEVQGEGLVWMCLDGASWQIEVAARGAYHRVFRHCPDKDDPIRLLGDLFLALSGREFDPIY